MRSPLSLHENFSLMFYIVAVLHDNTGSSTTEREADGDYGCSALLVALLLGAAPLARSVGCSLSSVRCVVHFFGWVKDRGAGLTNGRLDVATFVVIVVVNFLDSAPLVMVDFVQFPL